MKRMTYVPSIRAAATGKLLPKASSFDVQPDLEPDLEPHLENVIHMTWLTWRNLRVSSACIALSFTLALMVPTEATAAAKHARRASSGGSASAGSAMPAVNPATMTPLDHNN